MASIIIVLAFITITSGAIIGAFFRLSFAIRREDSKGSLRFDAPNAGAKAARTLVGVSRSGW